MPVETSGGSVKIVKIPVAWKMPNSEAMFVAGDKKRQNEIAERREAEQNAGCGELQGYLDMGYKIISSVPIEVSAGTFIVYTLYA